MRNGAPRSVAKGRRVMTNEATLAILQLLMSLRKALLSFLTNPY